MLGEGGSKLLYNICNYYYISRQKCIYCMQNEELQQFNEYNI